MRDKLDFANAARAQLDVVLQATATHFAGNHAFHIAQGLNHAEVDIAAENERHQHLTQFLTAAVLGAAHQSRFDHRVAFPVAPLLLIIVFQRREAHHQRAAVAKRPQAHVHAIDETINSGLIQSFNQPLAEAGEELRVIQLTAPTFGLTILGISKNQVDIRGEVQLAAAQLAHAKN